MSETPCSSNYFTSSKRKEVSVYFNEGTQKMPKLNSPNSEIDSQRPDVETIESDDEILSSIKQRLISKKLSKNDGNAENLVEIDFENSFEISLIIEDEIDDAVTKNEKKNVSRTKSLISNSSNDSSDDVTIDTKYLRNSRRSDLKKRVENEEQDEESNDDEEENDEDEEDEVKTDRMSSGVWQYFKSFSNEIGEYTICQVEGCEKNGSPIRIVENEYLLKIFEAICPEFKVPCRKTIVKLLRTCYESQKGKMGKAIEKVQSIVLTTDCWKSIQNFEYIGVKAHLIDSEFRKKNLTITTRHITGGKSLKNIAEFLKQIMSEFNISHKVKYIVTDNVITMKNGIEKILIKERIPCYAHLLNLMIERVFKKFKQLAGKNYEEESEELDESEIKDSEIDENEDDKKKNCLDILRVIKKCKSIVGLFNHSTELKEKLYEVQNSKNQPNKMLINCVSTRWNSEYLVVQRILEQMENVNEVLYNNNKHNHLCLRLSEKNLLKKISEVFEPFYNLTKKMSSERYPSINVIFYSIFSLRKKYKSNVADLCAKTKFLKSSILESVNFYVNEYKLLLNKTIILANFLTPNRKKFAIVDDPNERQSFIDFSKNAIFEILEINGNYSIAQPVKTANLDDSFDDNNYLPQPADQIENYETLKKEIETYEIDSNCEKESLLYRKSHKNDLPNLSNIAINLLGIPGSTTPSERLFSKCKFQFFDRRNRISPENLEALMFLCENKNEVIHEWDWSEI
ncbi:unnamed protein product [Brachionus calyciflorus]|uniref:HAT C-terminal dimerisation domain-containing protein n=1 Tax=Brachionus calyciflorus TaxID=104777 RepID=A0A814IVY7_9BILA|nr:unnamed protein product [Brachionus calyciflorus]